MNRTHLLSFSQPKCYPWVYIIASRVKLKCCCQYRALRAEQSKLWRCRNFVKSLKVLKTTLVVRKYNKWSRNLICLCPILGRNWSFMCMYIVHTKPVVQYSKPNSNRTIWLLDWWAGGGGLQTDIGYKELQLTIILRYKNRMRSHLQ